uniref:Uncharacterized protein n=1 Tax=Rhizophora mucronata TaxID=61149 RepID=A0A2P2ILS7_RHIMU
MPSYFCSFSIDFLFWLLLFEEHLVTIVLSSKRYMWLTSNGPSCYLNRYLHNKVDSFYLNLQVTVTISFFNGDCCITCWCYLYLKEKPILMLDHFL